MPMIEDDDAEIDEKITNNEIDEEDITTKEKEDSVEAIDEELTDISESQTKVESRGKILQRHKVEWRNLRDKIEDLKKEKKKLSNTTIDKQSKKSLTKSIQGLKQEQQEKHKQELEQFKKEESLNVPQRDKETGAFSFYVSAPLHKKKISGFKLKKLPQQDALNVQFKS